VELHPLAQSEPPLSNHHGRTIPVLGTVWEKEIGAQRIVQQAEVAHTVIVKLKHPLAAGNARISELLSPFDPTAARRTRKCGTSDETNSDRPGSPH
jgi:hypothetical protein